MRIEEGKFSRVDQHFGWSPQHDRRAQRAVIDIDTEIAAVKRLAQTALDPDFPRIAGCEADRPSARVTQDPRSCFTGWILRMEPFESFPTLPMPSYALEELDQDTQIRGLGNLVAQVNLLPTKNDHAYIVATL